MENEITQAVTITQEVLTAYTDMLVQYNNVTITTESNTASAHNVAAFNGASSVLYLPPLALGTNVNLTRESMLDNIRDAGKRIWVYLKELFDKMIKWVKNLFSSNSSTSKALDAVTDDYAKVPNNIEVKDVTINSIRSLMYLDATASSDPIDCSKIAKAIKLLSEDKLKTLITKGKIGITKEYDIATLFRAKQGIRYTILNYSAITSAGSTIKYADKPVTIKGKLDKDISATINNAIKIQETNLSKLKDYSKDKISSNALTPAESSAISRFIGDYNKFLKYLADIKKDILTIEEESIKAKGK